MANKFCRHLVSFTPCRKFVTLHRRLYFLSEGRHVEDFFPLKNPAASAGFEPEASMLTARLPEPLGKPATNSLQSGTACGASCCLASSWNARHVMFNVYPTQSAGSESPNLALMWCGRDFRLFTHDFPQAENSCCLIMSVLVMFRQAHKLVQLRCCTSTTDG
jgi:hypothetical protein